MQKPWLASPSLRERPPPCHAVASLRVQVSRRRRVLPRGLCLRTRCGSRGFFEQGGDCAILRAVDVEQRMKALVVARFHEVAELVGNNEFQA